MYLRRLTEGTKYWEATRANIDYKNYNGHHVVEGEYHGPVLTLANEVQMNKFKNTGGLPKMKNIIEVFPVIVEFVLKHDPNYKLPPEIEVIKDEQSGQVRSIKVLKGGAR